MSKQAFPRRFSDTEANASLKHLRISPQKLNLVAGVIRGKRVWSALSELSFNKKRISNDVKKLLMSAIANAENNHGLDVDRLFVREVLVGKSITMKRFQARAKGRAGRIQKPFSRINIVVAEREEIA